MSRRGVWLAPLPLALLAAGDRPADADVAALAASLRALYSVPGPAAERWGHSAHVTLPDGRRVPRRTAYRDDPGFVDASRTLLASNQGDDAPLGAWLLGTAPDGAWRAAEPALIAVLAHRERGVALESAKALAERGSSASLEPLRGLASRSEVPELRAAAAWAGARVAGRAGATAPRAAPARVRAGFRRGVNWWYEGHQSDRGAASFRMLASLGVDWVSIHSYDALQRSRHDPVLASGSRFGVPALPELVASAHAAGLKVMVKPHLEMHWRRPSEAEMRIWRGADAAAREALRARMSAAREAQGWHNEIEMRTEADWSRWFRAYEAYLLDYARRAAESRADLLCVGREIDRTVLAREADWRRLIARVRSVFPGPLVYSANFDTYDRLRIWDALDFVGISAYFPLSERPAPTPQDLAAGWTRVLAPMQAFSERVGRPVLFTEVGYPATADAARAPWREQRDAADVWLQSRCLDAALAAAARQRWLDGAFVWLWERSAQPSWRDASFAIQDKPAAFTLARWYRGL